MRIFFGVMLYCGLCGIILAGLMVIITAVYLINKHIHERRCRSSNTPYNGEEAKIFKKE